VTPLDLFLPLLAEDLVWVAEADGEPIGFSCCEAFDDALHLWEVAVRQDRQGQGAGRALIAAGIDAARARGLPAVTLTTFRDIPWNAPFYRRLGFVELTKEELNARLAADLAAEGARGLDVANRCAMQLTL
jgi:GNAT superfamily N-acetyltransferase